MTARTLALVAALGLLLTGCTAATPPDADEPSARDLVLAELGPYPADTVWTQAERDRALKDNLDTRWASLAMLQPSAVRPDVQVEREISIDEYESVLGPCFVDAGLELGGYPASEFAPQDAAATEKYFACFARFPFAPEPPANDEQLGYIYDYLTKFVAPCYEENGAPQPAAPTKEFFVENWPNQDWFPSYSAPEEGEALEAACPLLDA